MTTTRSVSWKPSNVTEPIITASSATVPGSGSRPGRPASGGRRPSCRPRRSIGAKRAKAPKYAEKASPRASHGSTPYRPIPRIVTAV